MIRPGAGVMRTSLQGKSSWVRAVLPAACLALFAILIFVTRRGTESWSSADFGLYIMHARNLVEGIPYAATGYIPNPDNTIISPSAYPVGYPFLLAFVYAPAGLNLHALETVGCIALIAIVAGSWVLARRSLTPGWALLAAAGVAFVPQLLDLRDTISSDLAFTAWVMLALCVHRRAHRVPALGVLLLAIFMAEATRSAGIALAAALIGADILARTPGWLQRLGVTLAATAAAVAVNHWFEADAAGTYLSYFSRLNEGPGAYLTHAVEDYLIGLSHALGFSFGKPGNLAFLAVFLTLASIGWGVSLRRGVTAAALFVPASAALLIAFPVRLETARYLVPILPLLVLYAVSGASILSKGRQAGILLVGLILVTGYAGRFVQQNPLLPLKPPVFPAAVANEIVRLGQDIPPGDIVLARNPRVVALYSGDRSSIWAEDPTANDVWSPARRMNARYLLIETPALDRDERKVLGLIAANPGGVDLVRQTRHFRLYRFRP